MCCPGWSVVGLSFSIPFTVYLSDFFLHVKNADKVKIRLKSKETCKQKYVSIFMHLKLKVLQYWICTLRYIDCRREPEVCNSKLINCWSRKVGRQVVSMGICNDLSIYHHTFLLLLLYFLQSTVNNNELFVLF